MRTGEGLRDTGLAGARYSHHDDDHDGSNAAAMRLGPSMALVELGRYPRNEAHIVVGRLESEGIDALAFDGGASIADGSWLLIPVRVMVDEDDLATATAIIAA